MLAIVLLFLSIANGCDQISAGIYRCDNGCNVFRLTVEINSNETFSLFGMDSGNYELREKNSPWFISSLYRKDIQHLSLNGYYIDSATEDYYIVLIGKYLDVEVSAVCKSVDILLLISVMTILLILVILSILLGYHLTKHSTSR